MHGETLHIDVAIAAPVPKPLTYSVPESLVSGCGPGTRVLAPLGARNVTGYVLGHRSDPPTDCGDIRPILDVLDAFPLFPAGMIPFFEWVADYYFYPLGLVIKEALPSGVNVLEVPLLCLGPRAPDAAGREKATALERRVLSFLSQDKSLPLEKLAQQWEGPLPHSTFLSLERRGWIVRSRQTKPGRVRPRQERFVRTGPEGFPRTEAAPRRQEILEAVAADGEIPLRALQGRFPRAAGLIGAMVHEGQLELVTRQVYRDPFGDDILPDPHPPPLNEEQSRAMSVIGGRLGSGFFTCLLNGVTGSGKTEIYLRTVALARDRGLTCLVLVPEIALITQTERQFRARFGDCVAVLHSGLTAGERYDQWLRILRGQAPITIGARSAIFAPYEKLDLIIVDEEHDESYKQDNHLRYHARDLAIVRARMDHALAVLGSATPSVQSCHNVQTGRYGQVRLLHRVQDRPLPEVEVVELRGSETRSTGAPLITRRLREAITDTLSRKEQVLLFLNRRGFATFPLCAACGGPVNCRHCDITLTLHRDRNLYQCHYCGFVRPAAAGCPRCGSPKVRRMGIGTEKVEEAVRGLFPQARVARMDRDATSRKGSLLSLLKGVRDRDTDIVVGTQMVAKGHDFPGITLVGILCADLSLGFPDYRAGERTFQVLAQVAGRAGRGDSPGRVILQTFNPRHFCIETARLQDHDAYYAHEITYRRELGYPPFSRLATVWFQGKDPGAVARHAKELTAQCRAVMEGSPLYGKNVELLGPAPAPIARIADRYRWHLLLKGYATKPFRAFLLAVKDTLQTGRTSRHVQVVLDVDPVSML